MKKVIALFMFLAASLCLSAQDEITNLQKYWHYRFRLVNHYMVVGENAGMSLPADIRNSDDYPELIRWGEAPVYLGYYIGVLATEYRLLKDNGQNTDHTLTELYYAIKAVLRLDLAGETYPVWDHPHPGSINGFLIRDDVPANFLTQHPELNFGVNPNHFTTGQGTAGVVSNIDSDYIHHFTADEPKAIGVSQDVMYELLMGFALVKRYVDDIPLSFNDYVAMDHPSYVLNTSQIKTINFNEMARDEANLIVRYMQLGSGGPAWILQDPDGRPVHLGSACFTYSYAIVRAGNYITGTDYTEPVEEANEPLWRVLQRPGVLLCHAIGEDGNGHPMALTLAAISNAWRDHLGPNANNTTPEQILANGDYDANTDGCHYIASHIGWDVFYGALWDVFHGGGQNYISDLCKAQTILNSAPFNGPFYHSTTDNAPGWCATRRFYDGVIENPQGSFHQRAYVGKAGFNGNFNGLDYMLLFNLYYLDSKQREQESANAATFYIPNQGFSDQYPWTYVNINPPFDSHFTGNFSDPHTLDFTLRPYVYNSLTISASPPFSSDPGHLTIKTGSQGVLFTNTSVEYGAYLNVVHDECFPPQPSWYFDPGMYMRHSNPNYNADEIVRSDISLYPNPSSSSFTLIFPQGQTLPSLIQIYNLQGAIVYEMKNDANEKVSVDVSTFNSGIYIVKITSGEKVYSKKLIKE